MASDVDYEVEELRDQLAHAGEAIRLLAEMVGDLLDAAKIEAAERDQYDEELARLTQLAALLGG